MNQLKLIAMLFMLVDHFAYVMIERGIGLSGSWYLIDRVMRGMGRVAFPIFCFSIVEGFQKTHDAKAYFKRLVLFALISEIPFDLAFRGTWFDLGYQNVFWTLAFGLALLILYEDHEIAVWKRGIGMFLCAFLPGILHTDYSYYGILVIFFMYLLREKPLLMCLAGYAVLMIQTTLEVWAAFGFLLILFYNGQRGKGKKFFFYSFYPLHLLIMVLLKPYVVQYFSGLLFSVIFFKP